MFPSPTKRVQKKWRKNHNPALGNLFPSGMGDSNSIHDSRSRVASQLLSLTPQLTGFPGASKERLLLSIRRLWTATLSYPSWNQWGKRILMGLAGANKHCDTNFCRFWEQLPLPPHTHAAHKYGRIFRAILDYVQSAFSVSQSRVTKNLIQRKRN